MIDRLSIISIVIALIGLVPDEITKSNFHPPPNGDASQALRTNFWRAGGLSLNNNMKLIDRTGQVFGFLTVKSIASRINGIASWNCECVCGNETVVRSGNLKTIRSCGCKTRDLMVESRGDHGMSHSTEYYSWAAMKSRCLNPRTDYYKRYGGRGIMVCARWAESFKDFLEDMGMKPSQLHELERNDNNGNYEPGNCRWATRLEQANNKRNNHWIVINGERLTISQWARRCGIRKDTLRLRLLRMTPELAVTTPVKFQSQRV